MLSEIKWFVKEVWEAVSPIALVIACFVALVLAAMIGIAVIYSVGLLIAIFFGVV